MSNSYMLSCANSCGFTNSQGLLSIPFYSLPTVSYVYLTQILSSQHIISHHYSPNFAPDNHYYFSLTYSTWLQLHLADIIGEVFARTFPQPTSNKELTVCEVDTTQT